MTSLEQSLPLPTQEAMSFEDVISFMSGQTEPHEWLPTRRISDKPLTQIWWTGATQRSSGIPELADTVRIKHLQLGAGRIAVAGNQERLYRNATKCSILASLGLSNSDIAPELYVADNTVKTHLRRAFQEYQIKDRAHIARRFLELGIYTITHAGEGLNLSPAELPVVDCISHGQANIEVGANVGISPLTVKSHLARIAQRTGYHSREQMAMAALLSGEIE